MKYLYFIILSSLILLSCEKDELITNAGVDGSSALKTKALFEPSPIDQLEGLAVNIKLVSPMPNNYNYLSSNTKNNAVDRHSVDDGSLRQRWYITKKNGNGFIDLDHAIKVAGGAKYNGYLGGTGNPDHYTPVLGGENVPPFTTFGIKSLPNTSNYNIYTYVDFSMPSVKAYLYANGSGRELIFGKINNLDPRAIWEIIPVEDYEFIEAKYIPVLGEEFKPTPVMVTSKTIHNNFSTIMNYSTKFSEEVTESSTFGKTEGLSITDKITISAKAGLPFIVNGTVNGEHTTAKNWSYQESKTENRNRRMEDNISITIPPYTSYFVDAYIATYEIDIKYVATFKGITSGRILTLYGRWKGVEATQFYYNGRDPSGKPVEIPGLRSLKELNGL